MAGHSQFKNIMHRKGAQDAKRAKIFAKLIREVIVSARIGIDPDANPRLRTAISACRSANMPKDNIDRAIKKAAGGDDTDAYEEIRYEGYGPGGVAIIVECLTDNRNRTASEVRSIFSKHGGNLGESGSVSFMFNRQGLIHLKSDVESFDHVFEVAAEAGAENIEEVGGQYEIITPLEGFSDVRDALQKVYGDLTEAKVIWAPQTITPVNEDTARTLLKLVDTLDDNEDVQNVFSNFDISNDLLQKLTV